MSNSAINTQVAQQKIGNVQNQADSSAVYSAGAWSFKNASAVTSVQIDNSGNVGVGITPVSVLDVLKVSAATNPVSDNTFPSWTSGLTLRNTSTTDGAYTSLSFLTGNAAGTGQGFSIVGQSTSTGFASNLRFMARTASGTTTEYMKITGSGAFSFQSANQSSDKAFLIKNTGEIGNGRNAVTLDAGNTGSSSSIFAFNKNNGNLWNLFNDTPANNSTDFAIWSNSTGGVTLSSNTATSWSPRSSDERKKKNFETTQGLEEILQIEPVKYQFNSEDDSSPKRLGFKAQNLQPIIPEMVFPTGEKAEDGSDYLTITPDYLLPVLVKAIQELSAKVDAQAAEIAALKAS